MFANIEQNVPILPLTENVPKNGITIKYLPKGKDPYVFDEVDCPSAKNADEQIFEGKEFKEIEQSNRHFLHFIAENSDLINSDGILSLRNISHIHDPLTFISEHQNDGFKIPQWANETIRKEIFRLYNLKNSFNFKTERQKRLLSGPLFTEILNRMESIALNVNCDLKEKFHGYSGHDGTVAGLLAILGINLEIFPTFSTAVLIELHQQINNQSERNLERDKTFFIRLFHKNETDGNNLWEFKIPNCGNFCSLKKLKEIKEIIELKEWQEECKNINNDDNLIFNNKVKNM
uniref:Acid phosphatase n=1 Tax=Meloidogyne hapla TaxID=6305 RepID=A0A1I8BGL7_MELHA